MLSVHSFLKEPGGSFVPVGQAQFRIPDPDYIEGALELEVNGVPILSLNDWDYIDQLWSYLINAMEEYSESGVASTRLPDQPTKLTLSRQGKSYVLVRVDRGKRSRSSAVEESEFFRVLLESGDLFFACMAGILPEVADYYNSERERLLRLRGCQGFQ
ncbi:hypothetical protein [Streptomyces malaysiensis]|uniref:Uncharacterized protein n=1 Tax=Streptomyces malaysiensis subsp. samsunensis TaxID=459658 RepID=A0A9X2LXL7_STRMQ|nr:hypothetical protein [Streptomyces samsunensis]MCQ8831708.1 hypothetical protein [Streptomyces samsunensis]